jgi:thioredoxin-like negative regulator of GroEL
MVISISSREELDAIRNASGDQALAVLFSSPWSGPSIMMEKYFESFAPEYRNVRFVKAEVRDQYYCKDYGVDRLPTLLMLKDRKEVGKVVGEKPRIVEDLIKRYD